MHWCVRKIEHVGVVKAGAVDLFGILELGKKYLSWAHVLGDG